MTVQNPSLEAVRPQPVAEPRRRGAPMNFRDESEFHQCWYPVALSSEVAVGGVIGAPFLDGRVVVYRTSDGVAHVHSAFCRHLGADLSIGRLVDDKLQCPFHYWQYDGSGACVHIPAGDAPPRQARLFDYPVAETLGIVWAFNGETPLHPAPRFDVDERELVVDVFRNPVTMPIDGSLVFLNSFDLQHFRVVHHMPIEVDQADVREENHTLTYQARITTPEFGAIVQDRKLWGVNTVTIESQAAGRKLYLMHSLCAVGQNSTRGILVNATPAAPEGDAEGAAAIRQLLADSRDYSLRLVNEDAPIFDTISFRRDCLTASDKLLGFGMRYISRYPRAHPGRDLIR